MGAHDVPTVEEILNDESVSNWLKYALSTVLGRDPVDALNDAEMLVAVLNVRLRTILSRGRH